MADHADHHHHAAAEKPNASTMMGFALFAGMAGIILALVAGVRGSEALLQATAVVGAIAIGLAILAVVIGKVKGWPTRGFLVSVLLGAVAIATWLVIAVWVGF